MFKFIITILLSLTFVIVGHAQTFKAGIFAGLTASQINGDNSAGFNKPGLEGGLRVLVNLRDKMNLGLELQYSQRGAKEESDIDGTPQNIYRTDYVSVPIIFTYKDWDVGEYSKLHFHGGLSYGRLVRAELDNGADNSDFISCWRENDLSILAGATYFINKNAGLTVRYNRSLILLYKNGLTYSPMENPCNIINTDSLAPYNLSFHFLYMF